MTPDEMVERLINFAARVGKVVDALPDTRMGRHIGASWCAAELLPRQTTKKRVLPRVAQTSFTSSVFVLRNYASRVLGFG